MDNPEWFKQAVYGLGGVVTRWAWAFWCPHCKRVGRIVDKPYRGRATCARCKVEHEVDLPK